MRRVRHGQHSTEFKRAELIHTFLNGFMMGFGIVFGAVCGLMLPLLLLTYFGP